MRILVVLVVKGKKVEVEVDVCEVVCGDCSQMMLCWVSVHVHACVDVVSSWPQTHTPLPPTTTYLAQTNLGLQGHSSFSYSGHFQVKLEIFAKVLSWQYWKACLHPEAASLPGTVARQRASVQPPTVCPLLYDFK